MGFRRSKVRILSPRPYALSGERTKAYIRYSAKIIALLCGLLVPVAIYRVAVEASLGNALGVLASIGFGLFGVVMARIYWSSGEEILRERIEKQETINAGFRAGVRRLRARGKK